MLFKSMSNTTDAQTERVLSINATLQEVFIVSVEVVSVPPRKNQKNAGKTGKTEKAGDKKAQQQDQPKKKSALKALFGG